ncbi:hypothetical protein [Dactylosporangium darangshiense]|uniref:hypothetical protein n=1 Tax=Dactylosporangium darangshiense TaxID=579108 RepID=UPI0036353415
MPTEAEPTTARPTEARPAAPALGTDAEPVTEARPVPGSPGGVTRAEPEAGETRAEPTLAEPLAPPTFARPTLARPT